MIQKLCPKCRKVYIPHHERMCRDCAASMPTFNEKDSKRRRNRKYDREKRDAQSAAFYKSPEWRRLRGYKINRDCICEVCRERPAVEVHHIVPIREDWERRLDVNNLQSLCASCHYARHHNAKGGAAHGKTQRTARPGGN